MKYLYIFSITLLFLACAGSKNEDNVFRSQRLALSISENEFSRKNSDIYNHFILEYSLKQRISDIWKEKTDSVYFHKEKFIEYLENEKTLDEQNQIEIYKRLSIYKDYIFSKIDNKSIKKEISGKIDTVLKLLPENLPESEQEKELLYGNICFAIEYFANLVLENINWQVFPTNIKFNTTQAVVCAESNTVFAGRKYRAVIFIASLDSTSSPEIIINNSTFATVENGKGLYEITTEKPGEYSYTGEIRMLNPVNKDTIKYKFSSSYTVLPALNRFENKK